MKKNIISICVMLAGMNVRGAYAEVTNTIPTLSPSAYYRLMIDAEPSRLADGE